MPNRHRGEIEAIFDDRPFNLVLTLGALAELESAFGDDDMLALAERFQSGRLSASDATRIIGAGLRGAGHAVENDDVARMKSPHGAAGFITVVAQLLAATFGGPLAAAAAGAAVEALTTSETAETPRVPFPGPR